jgi:hypothetical protein
MVRREKARATQSNPSSAPLQLGIATMQVSTAAFFSSGSSHDNWTTTFCTFSLRLSHHCLISAIL